MKVIITYKCEICNSLYNEKENAIDCERKGKVNMKIFKQGLMFSIYQDDPIIFAIAEIKQQGHYLNILCWACRDTSNGDNLKDGEYCGHSIYSHEPESKFKKNNFIKDSSIKAPRFKRMVKALKNRGIIPTYYNKKGKLISV